MDWIDAKVSSINIFILYSYTFQALLLSHQSIFSGFLITFLYLWREIVYSIIDEGCSGCEITS